jgi:hypothetical protein
MDRHDESKPVHSEEQDPTPDRAGDILGLGRGPVPKSPGDPTTEFDEESRARRRERATGADEPAASGTTSPQSKGATGIDMGSGGSGTDVSGG